MPSLVQKERQSSICLEAQTTAEISFLKDCDIKELLSAHLSLPSCDWQRLRTLSY